MTSEWRDIDFADADISLLGVTKITDVGYCFLLVAVLTVSTGIVFPCVLCLFRQVQASSDSSLLYYELFSLYGHIPRRCSSSSLSSYHSVSHEFLSLPFCLLRLYAEGIYFSTHDLTNFPVFVCWCSLSLYFHSPWPKHLADSVENDK